MSPRPFPLSWPKMLPRTTTKAASQFRTTLPQALKNVKGSLEAFARDSGKAVTEIVLSSNVGGIDPGQIKDTGVAAWFTWDGEQRCIAVDRYPKPEDNLQAIHHILEARRTEMRHGGLQIVRQTFKGFTALPAPDWSKTLGLDRPGQVVTKDTIEAAYRDKAKTAHPDRGGTSQAMTDLQEARRIALACIPNT